MLHVFNVNRGDMWTFDVSHAMERVLKLKNVISQTQCVSVEDQVILLNTGEALCDDEIVSSYGAGTETNPVFYFDRASIERDIAPVLKSLQSGIDFTESVEYALTLPPYYKTVDHRMKLALQLKDCTKSNVKLAKGIIQDKRLMSQGWQAAIHNLTSTYLKFQKRYPSMTSQCQDKLEQNLANSHILDGMADTLTILSMIPILPALLNDEDFLSASSDLDQSQVSLLHWIEANCKNVSIKTLLNDCKQKQEYLSQERLESLLNACKKAQAQAEQPGLREISGLKERFAKLDGFAQSTDQLVSEQEGIAKGFIKNRDTVKGLQNHAAIIDALQTFCESHIQQLKIMAKNEATAKKSLQRCIDQKVELAKNLHQRLRWLHMVQKKINEADVSLSMFLQHLTLVERQAAFLAQVKSAPTLYLSSLTEVVRRNRFKNTYLKTLNKAIVDAKTERDKEIMKRETFQSNIAGHFIQKLFRGFLDKPPLMAKKPLSSFDDNLPEVTEDQLYSMSKLLPKYKDILQVSITDSGLTSVSYTRSNQTSPITTLPEEGSDEQMHGSSPPELRSVSTSMTHSPTGSFAVVDSAAISNSHDNNLLSVNNGGEIPQEEQDTANLQDDQNDSTYEPQRAESSVTLTNESISQSPSNSHSDNESEFARLGDMSVGSPPDSEFFSILPQQFGDGSLPQSVNQKENVSTSASPVVIPESFESPKSFRRVNSGLNVGSIDSNSFHKVDELSSDDEMFHSITDDNQELKTMRKKLQKVQSDYDNLSETSTQEKEDLRVMIINLRNGLEMQLKNQQASEADYEERCSDSKMELNDLIGQLENERVERQKAWTERADLEKQLKMATEQYALQQETMHKREQEVTAKDIQLQKLQNDIAEKDRCHEAELLDNMRETQEFIIGKDDEISNLKRTMDHLKNELSVSQAALTSADDRIQELEDTLSEQERKEQEAVSQVLTYEGKLNELSNQLKFAFESQQKSSNEKEEAANKTVKNEAALIKANEQIASLTKFIADSESKISEYRRKIETLREFEIDFHQLESEKSLLESEVQSLNSTIDRNKIELLIGKEELSKTQSIFEDNAKCYAENMSVLRSAHSRDLKSIREQHEEYVTKFNLNFENQRNQLIEDSRMAVDNKDQEMRKLMEEEANSHRNEMDEHVADRMAEYALAQREIESIREELNESYKQLNQERRDAADLKDGLSQEISKLEQECIKLSQEKEQLVVDKTTLEEKLSNAELEMQRFHQQSNQESVNASQVAIITGTEDERELKRSRVEAGSLVDGRGSSVDLVALEADSYAPVSPYQREVDTLKERFRVEKLALDNFYKRKEQAASRRSQVVFNSAIQRLTHTKDLQIADLQKQLMVQSQMIPSTLSQSMKAASQQTTTEMTQSTVSLPSTSSALEQQASVPQLETPSQLQSSQTAATTRDKDRVTVANFQPGDTVLVCFNDMYKRFTLFTISRTLHFIHQDSICDLGLLPNDQDAKKTMTFAVLVAKEYCQARKAQNRFGIPVDTKFYRVRVSPYSMNN